MEVSALCSLSRLIEQNQEIDPDARVLEVRKANLAQHGAALKLRWQDGAFVLDQGKFGPIRQEDLEGARRLQSRS